MTDPSSRRLASPARRGMLVLAAVLAAAHVRADDVTPAAKEKVQITKTQWSWDNLSELFLGNTPAAPFGEGSVFVMRGELRNNGTKPVHHVVLRYELLDGDGKVLQQVEGFNRGAEAMRPDEEGQVHRENVQPIPAGGIDSYRMVFFHDEVPRFASQRVRVAEVHEEGQ